jgi:hypothetical protein
MEINFDPYTQTYDFLKVTETELQIFAQAFAQGTPFSNIPELSMFAQRIHEQLQSSNYALTERYRGQ